MSATQQHTPAPDTSTPPPSAPAGTLRVLAMVAGVAIANVYYNQPLLDTLRTAFPADAAWVGLVAAATQGGFALGMIFLSPLGDRMDRRRLMRWQIAGLCGALALAATAWSLPVLIGASVLIGLFASVAQQAGPFAAELAPPGRHAHAIGVVMSGLVLGILLGRTVSGLLSEHVGWRSVFAVSIVALLALAALITTRLPPSRPTSTQPYGALIRSLWRLTLETRELRAATLTGGALFAAFSAFWTALSLLLAGPAFGLGPQAAGLFGVIGAAGVLASPVAGRLTDRYGATAVISVSIGLVALSFLVFGWAGSSIAGLVAGVIILDVGLQSAQVSNQSRVLALRPDARSRMNTIYMTGYFVCGAIGSATAAFAWQQGGWTGVCVVGVTFAALAGLNHRRRWRHARDGMDT